MKSAFKESELAPAPESFEMTVIKGNIDFLKSIHTCSEYNECCPVCQRQNCLEIILEAIKRWNKNENPKS